MCARCKKPIDGEVLYLNKEKFHPNHFSCTMCKKELNSNCKELDQKLYCPPCYEKGEQHCPPWRFGLFKPFSLFLSPLCVATQGACAACHKPIQGRSMTALGKQWHPEV